jgi:hypothetical protein
MGEEFSEFQTARGLPVLPHLLRCTASCIGTIAEKRAPNIYGKMATAVFRLKYFNGVYHR